MLPHLVLVEKKHEIGLTADYANFHRF